MTGIIMEMIKLYLGATLMVTVFSGIILTIAKIVSTKDNDNEELRSMEISKIIKNSILLGIIWPKLLYEIIDGAKN